MWRALLRGARRARARPRAAVARAAGRCRRLGDATPGVPALRDQGPEPLLDQRHERNRALPQRGAEQVDGHRAHQDVRSPHREPGRDSSRVADVLAEGQPDVVEEQDRQRRHERAPAAAPMRPNAQRYPQHAEDQARDRDRELLVYLHQEGVRIAFDLLELLDRLAQIGEAHLAVALRRAPLLHQRVLQDERDVVQPKAHLPILLKRARAGLVDRAVQQSQRDPAVHFVREQSPLPRRDEALLVGLPLVRHEHVSERHLVRGDLVDVDHEVAERVVEDPLLHAHARLGAHDVEHERLERVVRLGDGIDHEVSRRGGHHEPERHHGPEKAQRAHPARLHRDDLHVGGQTAERDQDGEEHSDRDGQHQDGRQEIEEQEPDEGDGHALVDDQVHQVEDPVDEQQEGRDEQPEQKRCPELLPDVAVEDSH